MVHGTLPPGLLPCTVLIKKKVAVAWSLAPRTWSYLPRYSLFVVGVLKTPVYAPPPVAGLRAPLGSGMEEPNLLLTLSKFAMVVSRRPAGMQFSVATWQPVLLFVPITCVLVPGVLTLKVSPVKSPRRSAAEGTMPPVSSDPAT